MVRTDTLYEIARCQESMFQENPYYQNYWDTFNGRSQYCLVDQENVYFEGTRDSPLKNEDSAYLIFEFHKCSNATKMEGYPDCATPPEIETYLESKKIGFKVIN